MQGITHACSWNALFLYVANLGGRKAKDSGDCHLHRLLRLDERGGERKVERRGRVREGRKGEGGKTRGSERMATASNGWRQRLTDSDSV
jgi:hypothetical protein